MSEESGSRVPKLSNSLRGVSDLDDWTLIHIFEYLMVGATRFDGTLCPVTWPMACIGRNLRRLSTSIPCSAIFGSRPNKCGWSGSSNLLSLSDISLISKDIKYIMGTINGADYLDAEDGDHSDWDELKFKRDISNFGNLRVFSISECLFMTDKSWIELTIACPLLVIFVL